ncbi:MAG: hypothetical protein EZS28_023530 [Streblomastix strix]|uniref:Uncharacterized protein n=1 Tax=Streblomastix strix TaxID=222440 RepID=A0A5J4VEQ4_9EUKA|nr:MAG: hypothetical protein EZS28_023530 [Streblomastix strix]
MDKQIEFEENKTENDEGPKMDKQIEFEENKTENDEGSKIKKKIELRERKPYTTQLFDPSIQAIFDHQNLLILTAERKQKESIDKKTRKEMRLKIKETFNDTAKKKPTANCYKPFFLYKDAVYDIFKKKYPEHTASWYVQQMGKSWQLMNIEEQKPFVEKCKVLKQGLKKI